MVRSGPRPAPALGNRIRFSRPTLTTLGSWLLLATLLVPYVPLPGGSSVRFETFALPALLLLAMLFGSVRVPRFAWLLIAFWAWLLGATTLSMLSGADGAVAPSVLLGYLRPVLVAIVFYSLRYTPHAYLRLLEGFVVSALPIGLLAVAQAINFGPATAFTLLAYGSGDRAALARQVESAGWLSRASGTFETPAYAAIYFLLVVGTALWLV